MNVTNVKIVNYTGKYPTLCLGVLTLEIDGKEVKFGHDYSSFDYKFNEHKDDNYESFWKSGGSCGFLNNYSESYTDKGELKINFSDIPVEFQKYAYEIERVFNDNVYHGCCGGCL